MTLVTQFKRVTNDKARKKVKIVDCKFSQSIKKTKNSHWIYPNYQDFYYFCILVITLLKGAVQIRAIQLGNSILKIKINL